MVRDVLVSHPGTGSRLVELPHDYQSFGENSGLQVVSVTLLSPK